MILTCRAAWLPLNDTVKLQVGLNGVYQFRPGPNSLESVRLRDFPELRIDPQRFLDTRSAVNPLGAGKRLLPTWAVEVPVLTNAAINRTDIAAVDLNVTINETLNAGYFSVTTAGSSAPGPTRSTSTLMVGRSCRNFSHQTNAFG